MKCEVIKVQNVIRHPGADRLSFVVINNKPVVFDSSEIREGDTAVYIPVGAKVPVHRSEFDWLQCRMDGYHRVKPMGKRGIVSHGILIPAPLALKRYWSDGVNASELLGVKFDEQIRDIRTTNPRFRYALLAGMALAVLTILSMPLPFSIPIACVVLYVAAFR